jgi:hypothetical protein
MVTAGASIIFSSVRGTLQDEDTVLYKRSSTKIDAPTHKAGSIYKADNSINEDDGTYDGRLQHERGKAASVEFVSLRTAWRQRDTILYRNSSTVITAPAITGAGMYAADNQENAFGLYDSQLTFDRGTLSTGVTHASMRGVAEDADRILYKNSNAPIDAPANPVGGIYHADNTLQDDGTYDAKLQLNTAKELITEYPAETLSGTDGSTQVSLYRNSSTIPALPANVMRHMYQQKFARNDFGLYDGAVEHKATASQEFGAIISTRTDQVDVTQYQYANRDSWVDVPADQQGQAVFQRNTLDGTWSGHLNIQRDKASITWWGGTGEYCFHYVSRIRNADHHVYVYDKYTRSETAAKQHLNDALDPTSVNYTVLGANDGHITDISPLGQGRLRARRIELLTN